MRVIRASVGVHPLEACAALLVGTQVLVGNHRYLVGSNYGVFLFYWIKEARLLLLLDLRNTKRISDRFVTVRHFFDGVLAVLERFSILTAHLVGLGCWAEATPVLAMEGLLSFLEDLLF